MSARIPETDTKEYVQEYKRTCNQCGKVWHSLPTREQNIKKQIESNKQQQCLSTAIPICCNTSEGPYIQTYNQEKQMEHGFHSELDRLKSCPKCGSKDYKEKLIRYEKRT